MATAKQIAWRKKFARLYGKKRKAKGLSKKRKAALARKAIRRHPKKAFSTYVRYKRKAMSNMARRTRRGSRRGAPRKRYINISLIQVGHMAMQYSNITGKPLGAILDQLTKAIFENQGDVFDIVMAEISSAVDNVTNNTFQVAGKAALLAMFFGAVKSFVGHKKIFQIGKFRITV